MSAYLYGEMNAIFNIWNFDLCRAEMHMPSYAKKLVAKYNENGEIDQMLSAKW